MVSDIINKINEMFLNGYKYLHLPLKTSREISFTEENSNTKNTEVKYTAANHLLALKFDADINEINKCGKSIKIANGDMFLFFEDISGLKKMCDYIVFYKFDQKIKDQTPQTHLFCFLINLKSEKTGTSPKQLKAAEIFAEFIFAHAKLLLDLKKEIHFIKTLHKTPSSTLNKTSKKNTKPKAEYNYSETLQITRKADFDNLCKRYFSYFNEKIPS